MIFMRSIISILFLAFVVGEVCASSSIAVLVIGEHRLYDGTWPSHERHLYQPIRNYKSTKQLDVFTCQKEGENVPMNMPKPMAEFNVPKAATQVCACNYDERELYFPLLS